MAKSLDMRPVGAYPAKVMRCDLPPAAPTAIGTRNLVKPKTAMRPKVERPRMHKVILVNDDFTPREFVVIVLKQVFGMGPERAYGVMLTAHKKGCCVVAVYTRDVAESKATEATDAGRQNGYPLLFTTEPEE